MIVSIIFVFLTAIIGHVMAVITVSQAMVSQGKVNCSLILRNVYFDIITMLFFYATLPQTFALLLLNITTVKFTILAILDYDYIQANYS